MQRMLNEALVWHELKKEFFDSESRKKCIAALKSVPDADSVPVVHGHWIVRTVWHGGIGEIYSKCSVCGFETRGEPHTRGDRRGSNYCEDCGAKMDEEVEDETD